MNKDSIIYLVFIIIIASLVIFFVRICSIQGEKIAALEDVVFNYGLYPKIEKEVLNGKGR
jgi:hypothetical protein